MAVGRLPLRFLAVLLFELRVFVCDFAQLGLSSQDSLVLAAEKFFLFLQLQGDWRPFILGDFQLTSDPLAIRFLLLQALTRTRKVSGGICFDQKNKNPHDQYEQFERAHYLSSFQFCVAIMRDS